MAHLQAVRTSLQPQQNTFTQLTTYFDPHNQISWGYMHAEPRPCFTPTLLQELLAWCHEIAGQIDDPDQPDVRYMVTASSHPGVFNYGGDLNRFAELIVSGERDRLAQYAQACIEPLYLYAVHLPIIMLTADARTEAQATCEAAGVDAFLTKPVNGRELAELIGHLAGQQTQTGVAAAREVRHADGLDESVLDELALMGGNSLVEDLLTSFEEDSRRAVQDIERALATQDYGLWNDQLHMLKGGARDIGAHQLAQQCADAERVKPFEFTSQLAHDRLHAVQTALTATQAALVAYQANKLSAEQL